jgi:hypothetical protein
MSFFSGFPTRPLTVLAQDPDVLQEGKALTVQVPVPRESLAPGPKGHRIHVVDFDATRNRFYPPQPRGLENDPYRDERDIDALVADRHFHAQNVYGLMSTTILRFEAALGRHVSWGFASNCHHLKVAPHAFAEANAYYSRRDEGIVFGYLPAAPARRRAAAKASDTVFTCLSADIVVHETTHAILDGLRSDLMRPSTPDQPAFHEAFADIVALLSALSRQKLIELALPKGSQKNAKRIPMKELTIKALSESVLLGLAEQFGRTIAQKKLDRFRGSPLRRSVEIKATNSNYQDQLAGEAEPHDLGEILVAAVMNSFLAIWEARVRPALDPTGSGFADRSRAAEEGAKAAQNLLHMAVRAIDYMPPIHITFRDFLSALLTADQEAQPDDSRYGYREALTASFRRYGILPAAGARSAGMWNAPPLMQRRKVIYGFSGHAEMMWDREAVMRFLWENRRPLGIDTDAFTKVTSVRPAIRVSPDGFVLRETVVEYFQLLDINGRRLKGLGLRKPAGMRDSTPVRLLGGGTLIFDDYGNLKFHVGSGILSQRQNQRLRSLWAHGQTGLPDQSAVRRFEQMHRLRAASNAARLERGA